MTTDAERLAALESVHKKYREDDCNVCFLIGQIATLRLERNEARAEVERLRAELERVISTAAIAVRGIMQRATPPSADDVEWAREIIQIANRPRSQPGICGSCGATVAPLVPGTKCQNCRSPLPYNNPLPQLIAAALTAAREQGEAKGRAEGARQMRERAAQVASEALGGYLCPYGRDKKGDPTWNHTDKDKCPVCGANGEDALFVCHDTYSGRIAAAIRALPEDENAEKGQA